MNELLTQEEFITINKKRSHYESYSNRINEKLKSTTISFVEIGYYLNLIKNEKLYELEGYNDIYEYSGALFGLSKTTTSNFIGIFDKFGEVLGNEYYKTFAVKKEYEGFSLSKLIELLPIDDNEMQQYKASMTISQIRSVKASNKIDATVKEYMRGNNKICEYIVNKLSKYIQANIIFELKNHANIINRKKEFDKISDYFLLNNSPYFVYEEITPDIIDLTYSYIFKPTRSDILKQFGFKPAAVKIDIKFIEAEFNLEIRCQQYKGNNWYPSYNLKYTNNLDQIGTLDDFASNYLSNFVVDLLRQCSSQIEKEKENVKVDLSEFNEKFVAKSAFETFNLDEYKNFLNSDYSKMFDLYKCQFMSKDCNYKYSHIFIKNENLVMFRFDYNNLKVYSEYSKRTYEIRDFINKDDVRTKYLEILNLISSYIDSYDEDDEVDEPEGMYNE